MRRLSFSIVALLPGADWETWHVKDVATGRDLPDTIQWSKFSGAAWAGNGGSYYELNPDSPDEFGEKSS